MKIAELIQILKNYDPELKVVVEGYEGGYEDPSEIEYEYIKEGVNIAYCEKYGYSKEGVGELAVCIHR